MSDIHGEFKDGTMYLDLVGRIDSNNAPEVEQEIRTLLEDKGSVPVVVDMEGLEYISSAGLRVLLHIRKEHPEMRIVQTCPEVYEILDMTGFTEMMTVERAYRRVSVEGCEEIGRGANGTIYRIDQDNVVKVYNNADALDDIRHEREVARLALILGIPTAISYDVVRVDDSYGSVFELLNARSFSEILVKEPEKMDWCVGEYVKMLRKIHSTVVPAGKLPDMRETVLSWAKFMQDYLPEGPAAKLLALVEAVPHNDHMLHGDYHTKNLELQNDEVLLIDMDTLAIGDPIFELASMFNAFIGFSERDHEVIREFQGFDFETSKQFWHKTLAAYLETTDEEKIREVEDKARIIGYTRLIRRSIRRKGLETPEGREEIEFWKERLIALLDKTDTLLFSVEGEETGDAPQADPAKEIDVEAITDNLTQVLGFVDEQLEAADCPMKTQVQIDVAVEEIFVNVAHYAYAPETGRVRIRMEIGGDPAEAAITFIDRGVPYDPLAKEDPDVTLSAEEREIGGLGIYMVKQSMDDVIYRFEDGQNILTLKKQL